MFFKNQGHNALSQQIQGQSLALKDVWQPYLNISTEKYMRNYRKSQRNFLSACSVVTSSWKQKIETKCNCRANMYCKPAQACAEMASSFLLPLQLH